MMAKYSVYIRESLTGTSNTVFNRKEMHSSSRYFEYDNVEELANYIRTATPRSDFLTDLAYNINLKYKLEVVYTQGFLETKGE